MPSSSSSFPLTEGVLRFKEEAKSLDNYANGQVVENEEQQGRSGKAPRCGFNRRPGR